MALENKIVRKTQRTSQVSTILSISLVLFMLGLLGVLLLHARRVGNYVKENVELSVVIQPDADSIEVQNLYGRIASSPIVKSVKMVSSDEAATDLKKDLGEDFISFLGYNPLNASVDIRIRAEYADTVTINTFIQTLSANKAVSQIHYQASLVQEINKNMRTLTLILLGFSTLLFIISVALINNTIRLSLYTKRLLIKSMLLVGATKGFIRKPFLSRSLMNGLAGGCISILLLASLMYIVFKKLPELSMIRDYRVLGILAGCMVCIGVFLSLFCTLFAVNKYLRLRSEELY